MVRVATIVSLGIAILLTVGCYRPALRDCTVECSAPTDCSGDQVCRDGWCIGTGADACSVVTPGVDSGTQADAARDAAPPDASSLCPLGCTNGTCDANGVCVIDCSATGSCASDDVECPANLPCRVVCGDGACLKKVVCGLATTCVVQCTGAGSCAEEIHCGSAPCDVTCSGSASCRKKAKCSSACACDVRCTGAGSCPEDPECPMGDACMLGRGCSSQLAGCETCPP